MSKARELLRRALVRIALLLTGSVALIAAVWINVNAGKEVISGVFSPDSPEALVISMARLLAPAAGLWLVYRALR